MPTRGDDLRVPHRDPGDLLDGDSLLVVGQRTTASAIARLEAGGTYPNFAILERLADALGVQLRLEVADATDLPAVTFGVA